MILSNPPASENSSNDGDGIETTILYTLVEICKTHRVRVDQMLSAHGVSSGQETFLLALWKDEGLTHAQLAARLRIQPSSITVILNRLEKAGLIVRQQDTDDLRVWRVFLTEQGRALREKLQAVWWQAEQQTTVGLNTEERLLLRRLLLHVYHNILDTQ